MRKLEIIFVAVLAGAMVLAAVAALVNVPAVSASYIPSDQLIYSSDAEVSTASTSPWLAKTWTFTGDGSLRIDFDLMSELSPTVYGQVYRNGTTQVGTLRSTTATDYTTFTENISGWSANDTIDLKIYTSDGGCLVYAQNFRIYGSENVPPYPILLSPENNYSTTDNKPTFAWTRGSGADNHRIEVDNDNNWANGVVDNVVVAAPNDNTWTKTGVGYPVGTYYWRVWAQKTQGENVSENTWTFYVCKALAQDNWAGGASFFPPIVADNANTYWRGENVSVNSQGKPFSENATGVLESSIFDAGETVTWEGAAWNPTENLSVKMRSMDDSNLFYDNETFDDNIHLSNPSTYITNGENHTAFGELVRLNNGDLMYFYRQAHSHSNDNTGYLAAKTSHDNGQTWGNKIVVMGDTDGSDNWDYGASTAAGITPNGTVVIATCRRNSEDLSNYVLDTFYIRSTDNGATFSEPKLLVHSDGLGYSFAPWGKIFYVPTKGLAISMFREHVENYYSGDNSQIYLFWSANDGVTFDNENYTTVYNGPLQLSETDFDYIGSGRIIGIARSDIENQGMQQFTSSDYGVTWTRASTNLFYNYHSSMAHVNVFTDPSSGDKKVLMTIGNRTDKRIDFKIASAAEAFANPQIWNEISSGILNSSKKTTDFGYPSAYIFTDNYPRFLVVYYGGLSSTSTNLYCTSDNIEGSLNWRKMNSESNVEISSENGWMKYTENENVFTIVYGENEEIFKSLSKTEHSKFYFDMDVRIDVSGSGYTRMIFLNDLGPNYATFLHYQVGLGFYSENVYWYCPDSGDWTTLASFASGVKYKYRFYFDTEDNYFEIFIDNSLMLHHNLVMETGASYISYLAILGNMSYTQNNYILYLDNLATTEYIEWTSCSNGLHADIGENRYAQYRVEFNGAGTTLENIQVLYIPEEINNPPNIENVLILDADGFLVSNINANVYYRFKVGVSDPNYLKDVNRVELKLYENTKSQGANDNVANHYTFKWTRENRFENSSPIGYILIENSIAGNDNLIQDNYIFVIKLDNTANAGNWNVWTRAVDNSDNQDNAEFLNRFAIVNASPTTPTTLTLNSPKVGENLIATGSGSTDAENDAITYYYRFYNQTDGVERQAYSTDNSYVIAIADAHDNIIVDVKAYDGYGYSSEKENSIIIGNTVPTAPTTLTLNSPKVGENLTATASGSTDNDNDTITYYYKFYNIQDAATRQAYSTDNSYVIAVADAHDTITVYSKAYDGYEYSGEKTGEKAVTNSPPTAALTSPDNGATDISTTPTLDWAFSDNDNDNQTKYWVLVDDNFDFSSPVENTGEVASESDISPSADTWVYASSPDSNYGTSTLIDVWGGAGTAQRKRSFLKFSLSSIPAGSTIDSATLYLKDGSGAWINVGVYGSDNISWQENIVTWNNQPVLDNVLQDNRWVQDGWYSWNVTNWISTKWNVGQTVVSVGLKSMTENTYTGDEAMFYSKEISDGSLRPILHITFTTENVTNTYYAITTPLNYSTKYYWKVNVYDNYEWSGWQGIWNFTTENGTNVPPNRISHLWIWAWNESMGGWHGYDSAVDPPSRSKMPAVWVWLYAGKPTDNDSTKINVFFYDNATKNLIDNIWTDNYVSASVTWGWYGENLVRGQTYAYFARGQDSNGAWGENGDVLTFSINQLSTASVVAPENGATNTSSRPTLDWAFSDNDNDSPMRYWVIVDNDSDFSSPIKDTGDVTSDNTFYHITTPLNYLTTYYWKVRVYGGSPDYNWYYGEWSGWQGVWSFTTAANVAPNKPTNLLPSIRQTTTSVTISCVATDNNGDTINVFFYNNATKTLIDNVWVDNGGTATRTWDNLTRGTTYTFFARGYDGTAWGENSDTQSFLINSLPTLPTNFTDLGMNLIDHTPSVSWTKGTDADNDNVTTYVYVGTTSTPTTVETSSTGVPVDLGNTVPLSDGVTYYYRLRSYDNYEYSDYTTADQFRMNSKPTVPTNLTDLGMNLTDHTPEISWTKGTDAEGDTVTTYVYVDTNAAPTTLENSTTNNKENIGENSITLVDGTTYYYRLRSWDGYEWSENYSSTDTFRMNTPPTAPTNFTDLGINLTDHNPAITWTKGTDNDNDNVTTYVYVGTNPTPTTVETFTVGAGCYLGNTVALSDGTIYYYRLRSWDNYEWSDYTTADIFRMNSKPANPTSWTDLGENLTDHTPTVVWSGQSDAENDNTTVYVYVGVTSTPVTEEGHSTAGTLDLGSTVVLENGTTYYYRLRAYDGYEWNDAYTTADQFSIAGTPPPNTPPVMSTNVVTPSSPIDSDNLVDTPSATDANGDSVTFFYQWYENSIAMSGETSAILSASYTLVGSKYKCQVTPYDGHDNGTATYSNEVTVSANPVWVSPIAENLKTENQTNPTSLSYTTPTFSWDFYSSYAAFAPSTNLLFENTTEVIMNSSTWTLKFQWTASRSGTIRIDFDLHSDGDPARIAYGQIYRNGENVGTLRSTYSASYVTFTENIAGWQVGDNVQLFIRCTATGSYNIYAKNFRIYGSHVPTAYEVWVGTSSGASDMWNSGQVTSSSKSATYAGSALATNTTYYVQVRGADNHGWSNWATGTFKMISQYIIKLYWEDNNQPANENATLWAAMASYGSRENSIVNGSAFVTYPERPYYMKVTYGNYYRVRIPSVDNGTIYFYITKDNKLAGYSFALVDLTGMFGPPNGTLKIAKMYGENLMVINEDYWAADSTIATYLIQTNRYQLSAKSGIGGGERDLDGYTMGLTSPITIQIGAGGEYPNFQEIYDNIYWVAYRDTDNTTIKAIFQDNTGNALTASVSIYDENGTLCSLMEFDNGNFIATWLDAHPDAGYNVVLYETRNDENLPSITFSTPIAAVTGTGVPTVTLPPGGAGFGNPVPLAAIGSFVILGAIGMAFDFMRSYIAGLAIAIGAIFLWGLGWLPVNLYTVALVLILAVLFSLGWRRYG